MPILYTKVAVKPGMLLSFACTVYKYPHLLRRIQSLTVHDHNTIDSTEAEHLSWVITLLENLSELIIKGGYTQFSMVPGDLVLRHSKLYVNALQSPLLGKLRNCTLSLGQGDPWDMADRECIFTHPNLRNLTIIGAQMDNFHSFTEHIKRTSPLEGLFLYCCDLSPVTLHKILSVPRNLQSFTYVGARQVGAPLYTSPRPDEYIAAMQAQAASLKTIAFHPWNFTLRQPHAITFYRFTALQSLTFMPFYFLTRENPPRCLSLTPLVDSSFPASLTSLKILQRDHRVISPVENGMMDRLARAFHAGALPNLRLVELCVSLQPVIPKRLPDLPRDWDLYFRGRVCVKRGSFWAIQQRPLGCHCCDFDVYKVFVDNWAVEVAPLPPGFDHWLSHQLFG
ncbi:uncharacterized protein APUU_41604S [Aspergillus puulaauensis]|uniref:F-box domain-containing protein n=1 Tax=Aspergillus puulaauensis TaxID=1220207 RepID=A0A7R7XP62_9EURO|nr:uncharacterized protein APUU_41604S [Aspergillus puulaauensis]BCS25160.1 hypothetical protein APUU_41604S [Aspergillus puulaauensis]